jgi:hypothetical protein
MSMGVQMQKSRQDSITNANPSRCPARTRLLCALLAAGSPTLGTTGCAQKSAGATPAPVTSAPPEVTLAVLPNNTTVQAVKDRLSAVGTNGEIAWQLTLPEGDMAIAPVAVAMNSVTYVRGAKSVHALLPEGKWLWSRPLDGRSYSRTRASDSPVAMSDSTVALVIGDDVLRFDHSGAVRWRVTIPDGHVISQPAAGMDGSLIISTTAGIYSINPEGNISWKRVLGN